jgi:hypothetical protein
MTNLVNVTLVQLILFSKGLSKNYEMAVRIPCLGEKLFFPLAAKTDPAKPPTYLIIDGVLENGEVTRVFLGPEPFPLALVAVPKPVDEPRRVFGFEQAESYGDSNAAIQ